MDIIKLPCGDFIRSSSSTSWTKKQNHCKSKRFFYHWVLQCTLPEAWAFYQHVLELQSLECPNPGLHEDIQSTVVSAKVTRLLGLLFNAYIKEPSNIQKQRAVVQPILQELRSLVGQEKEKEVVPHYLYDKARKTLNLQKQP
eukprot:4542389-Amphidinium_carterae.5